MREFDFLTAKDIECRIQSVKDNGAVLLLYKTARIDAKVLDAHFGKFGWQSDYKSIDGRLYCGIGIYDKATQTWIWKWDVGTESNMEAEKGQASDAFKRAGFKWGIGAELYNAPFIFINGAGKYDRFKVTEVSFTEDGEFKTLEISKDEYGKLTPAWSLFKKTAWNKEKQEKKKDGEFICSDCGKAIKAVQDGKRLLEPPEIAERTEKAWGRQLCLDCAKNAANAALCEECRC